MASGSGKRSNSRSITSQFIAILAFWDRRLSHFFQMRTTRHLNLPKACEFPVIP